MHRGYAMVKDAVRSYPLPLLSLKDSNLVAYAESFLKYDTGIEIECSMKDKKYECEYKNFNILMNGAVPDLVAAKCDSSEQRYRIPTGIKGLVCLYNLCEQLKIHSLLNKKSGIHYHIDFRDCQSDLSSDKRRMLIRNNNTWIMNTLKSWNYTGGYNAMRCGDSKSSAVHFFSGYQTIEFRIGEMSFDYEVLVKRIIHCQNIVRKLKDSLKSASPMNKPAPTTFRRRVITRSRRNVPTAC